MKYIVFILSCGLGLFPVTTKVKAEKKQSLSQTLVTSRLVGGNDNLTPFFGEYLAKGIIKVQLDETQIGPIPADRTVNDLIGFRWEIWVLGLGTLVTLVFLWWRRLAWRLKEEQILNYFATSLYGRNTVEDVFWDIAKNCISQLKFEDCVIYQYDENKQILVQKAAFGPKNPEKHIISNPITIPLGEGITGYAALHAKPVVVPDTTKDSRYIQDDQKRYSELAVPIIIDSKIFGVIDTEHSKKNFYSRRHVNLLLKIADLCSQKLSRYLTEEKLRSSIARDLHDEIGSTLTSINITSKIALEQTNPEKVRDYLNQIRENSRLMMDAMSDMVWAINPDNDSLQRMVIRLKEFASEILEPTGISYSFLTNIDLNNIRLDLKSRKDLYLIVKEAITNAAKYSQGKKVTIDFQQKDDSITVKIEDDGIGMIIQEESAGNGLKNMRYRARTINSRLSVQSQVGKGTVILVETPIT